MAIEVYHGYKLTPSGSSGNVDIFTDLVFDGFNGGQNIENNSRDKAIFNISLVGDKEFGFETVSVNYYARGYINDPENSFEFGSRTQGGSQIKPTYTYTYYFESFKEYELYDSNYYYLPVNSFPLLSKEINNGDILYIEELRVLKENTADTFSLFCLMDKNEELNNNAYIKKINDITLNQNYILNLDFNSISYYEFIPDATATYYIENLPETEEFIYPKEIIYNTNPLSARRDIIRAIPETLVCDFFKADIDLSSAIFPDSYFSVCSKILEKDTKYKICFKRAGYYQPHYVDGMDTAPYLIKYFPMNFILKRLELKINYHLSKNIIIQKTYFSNNIVLESFNNLKKEGNLTDREDWNFLGWAGQNNSDESQYNDAAELELSATETEIDLYAIYDKDFIVTFYTGEDNEIKYSLTQNYILNNLKENNMGIPKNLEFTFPDAGNLDLKINNNFELGDNRIFTSYNYWSKDDNSDWVPLGGIESCENGEIYYLVYNRQENNNLTITYRKNDGGSLEVESNYFKDVYTNDQFYINKKLQEIKFIIKNNSFKRTNYTFVEWNTAQDGSGTSYKPGQEIPFTLNSTLYAIWKIARIQNIFYCRNGKYDISPSYLDNIYYCKEGKWYPAKMEDW